MIILLLLAIIYIENNCVQLEMAVECLVQTLIETPQKPPSPLSSTIPSRQNRSHGNHICLQFSYRKFFFSLVYIQMKYFPNKFKKENKKKEKQNMRIHCASVLHQNSIVYKIMQKHKRTMFQQSRNNSSTWQHWMSTIAYFYLNSYYNQVPYVYLLKKKPLQIDHVEYLYRVRHT